MDKKLLNHERFMKNEIKNIEAKLAKSKNEEEKLNIIKSAEKLYKYHREAVRNFQHERLIHLIVTVFFASMQIIAIAATISFALLPISITGIFINWLMITICIILAVTAVFYVRHYYVLENGVQRLYEFSKKLNQIIN